MTRRHLHGGALSAARLYDECLALRGPALLDRLAAFEAAGINISSVRADGTRGFSLGDVAWLHGVSRQAVSAARKDPGRFARTQPAGPKLRAGEPVVHSVRLRLVHPVTLALTDGERGELEDAAERAGMTLPEWARGVVGDREMGPAAVRDLLLAESRAPARGTPWPEADRAELEATVERRRAFDVDAWLYARGVADLCACGECQARAESAWLARRRP
jgi:hypothetical protein